ncbi:LssY C-terminal domain-containing protein [Photobacterium chitinilyticum]|uniref:LssY C-terminal domain-containing protein n=1 Tax=Photobacterium chitinilyticum TaxID=2485123 RepID=UPI001F43144D|nr:LssY C-terminal domain-containing protein [Photobacterium chitinilyticum]
MNISVCWLVVMLGANYYHFFVGDAYAFGAKEITNTKQSLPELDYTVYPGLAPVYQAQPINIVVVGSTPQKLMDELGWIENKTFSRDDVTFSRYLSLLSKELPPISDLYWDRQPQWYAYQLAGDLINRKHIRWWYAGKEAQSKKEIWVGSVSYDNALKLAHYKGIITILHAIDPDIDMERDKVAESASEAGWAVQYKQLGKPVAYSKSRHYFSDGRVVVLSKKKSINKI